MKLYAIAGAAIIGVGAVIGVARAEEHEGKGKITGVLIDNACGEKQMDKDDPQAAAMKHPKACCTKEGCAKSGYAVISGKKLYKLDDKGNEMAKEYLAKDDSKTKVMVEGEEKDGVIAVTSLHAVKGDKDKDKDKDGDGHGAHEGHDKKE